MINYEKLQMSLGKDEVLCKRFLEAFLEYSGPSLSELEAALSAQDKRQIGICFHKVLGMVANLCFDEFLVFLDQIKHELGDSKDLDNKNLAIVKAFHADAVADIRRHLESMKA